MKRPSIHELVFRKQFPRLKPTDSVQTFIGHVQTNLVPEVRVEVQTFYGALDSLEAQYPGLDYTSQGHRKRLARFPWHRRLFRVFDELGLTDQEIHNICQWEGTRSAKEKYEAETGQIIRNTTLDGISVAPTGPSKATYLQSTGPAKPYLCITPRASTSHIEHIQEEPEYSQAEDSMQDDSDVGESVGAELNHQLLALADGDMPESGPLEEWLKYMTDREQNRDAIIQAIRDGRAPPTALLEQMRQRQAGMALTPA